MTASWNPFGKPSCSRANPLAQGDLKRFEKDREELTHLEKSCKKLCQDLKKYQDSIGALYKCEGQLTQSLEKSHFTDSALENTASVWHRSAEDTAATSQNTAKQVKLTCTEPLKRYTDVFGSWQNALKKWDSNLQECTKFQGKIEKYQNAKDPQSAAKLEQHAHSLESSRRDFESYHRDLQQDLSRFKALRSDLFQPSLEALMQLQAKHFSDEHRAASQLCTEVHADSVVPASDDVFKQQLRHKFQDIMALSIVVDE